jgi:hypothetical protein
METVLILIAALVAFDLVSWRRGFDSRDVIESPEWERLQRWQGFH